MFLGFGLMLRHNKIIEDITVGCRGLERTFFTIVWQFTDYITDESQKHASDKYIVTQFDDVIYIVS